MQRTVEAVTVYLKSQIYVCKTAFSENKHPCGCGQEVLTIIIWHQINYNFLLSFSRVLTNEHLLQSSLQHIA